MSRLVEGVSRGDPDAEREMFAAIYPRLVGIIGRRMARWQLRVEDEEDVATAALQSWFTLMARRQGEAPQSWNELWQTLLAIGRSKAIDANRRHFSLKRGGGRVRGDSCLGTMGTWSAFAHHEERPAEGSIDPSVLMETVDSFNALLESIDDELTERIILLRMESFTYAQIAAEVGCSTRTVERRIDLAHDVWSKREQASLQP